MKTLYVSDLDGTLLRDDATLSDFTRRELCALLEEGIPITAASARSIFSMKPVLGDIPFRLPVVEGNGAFVTDYATGRHMAVNAMGRELAREAHALMSENGASPLVFCFNGERDLVYYRDASTPGMSAYMEERRAYRDDRLRYTEDLTAAVNGPANRILSLTVIEPSARALVMRDRITESLEGRLHVTFYEYRYMPGWHFLSLHDPSATKRNAISFLRERYAPGTALAAFGDDENDEEMVRTADLGVAVSNAKDAVKAAARLVIGSNMEDSVVKFIRKHSAGSR